MIDRVARRIAEARDVAVLWKRSQELRLGDRLLIYPAGASGGDQRVSIGVNERIGHQRVKRRPQSYVRRADGIEITVNPNMLAPAADISDFQQSVLRQHALDAQIPLLVKWRHPNWVRCRDAITYQG